MIFLRIHYLLLVLTFSFLSVSASAQVHVFNGRVVDTTGQGLPFATVRVPELDLHLATSANGTFKLTIPQTFRSLEITASYIGKQSGSFTLLPQTTFINLVLRERSLSLDDVQVSAIRNKTTTPSSIVFNRDAIEQIQAFSLADVLNNLPGKTTTASQLQSPTTLTLRDNTTGAFSMNNSLGAAIIMDGLRISNDANMQSRSLSIRGMGSSAISNRNEGVFDVPFTGLDLRDIATDNIESIEVITGVAPAQYGELTSGAVIINRQAGKSKFQFNARLNAGSTEFSLSKGLSLGSRLGALNVSVSYLNSNKDPRDKVKSFNRVSSGLMWTTNFGDKLKNTLSVDYNTRLDNVKQDPDDDQRLKTYARSRSFSLSNRAALQLKGVLFNKINMNVGYSKGYQDTYNQWLLNGPPKGLANKDTTGVYEGIFLPGAYLAEERIIGEPINVNGTVNTSAQFQIGRLHNNLSFGADLSYSDNVGKGIVTDPERPRWIDVNNQNTRPVNYEELLPAMVNTGIYLQDNINGRVGAHNFTAGIGLRYNNQNGSSSLQPRMNLNVQLSQKLDWSISYGISSKSPTLAHRYPAPAWLDIAILNLYTGFADRSLFLVYTKKIEPDNSNLKPARSTQLETGLRYKDRFFNTSIFLYAKKDRNGFNSYSKFEPITIPNYGYTYTPGQPISYYPTGDSSVYSASSLYIITNGLQSDNYGAEWMLQTRKIKAIQTSFAASTAFNYSTYQAGGDLRTIKADQTFIDAGGKAWYGVYRPEVGNRWSLVSKINSDTHIPKLGFIITLSADVFWNNVQRIKTESNEPIGYLDQNLKYYAITKFDPASTEHGYLKIGDFKQTNNVQPFTYANLNMRIAKELKDQIRISLNLYNVFNIKPEHYDAATQTYVVYNNPVSITAGINVKF